MRKNDQAPEKLDDKRPKVTAQEPRPGRNGVFSFPVSAINLHENFPADPPSFQRIAALLRLQ